VVVSSTELVCVVGGVLSLPSLLAPPGMGDVVAKALPSDVDADRFETPLSTFIRCPTAVTPISRSSSCVNSSLCASDTAFSTNDVAYFCATLPSSSQSRSRKLTHAVCSLMLCCVKKKKKKKRNKQKNKQQKKKKKKNNGKTIRTINEIVLFVVGFYIDEKASNLTMRNCRIGLGNQTLHKQGTKKKIKKRRKPTLSSTKKTHKSLKDFQKKRLVVRRDTR
jgi:hypothetical protein